MIEAPVHLPESQVFVGESIPPTAGISESQKAAIKATKRIANRIIEESPEIADEYRSDKNILIVDLAARYIPEETETNREIASNAVGKALQILIPREEYIQLLRIHRQAYHERLRQQGYYQGPEHKERSRKGAQANLDLGRDHSIDFVPYNLSAGRTLWQEEERQIALQLANDPDFRHKTGRVRRYPDYQKIAEVLNARFHQGAEMRSAASVSINVRDWKIRNRRKTSKSRLFEGSEISKQI